MPDRTRTFQAQGVKQICKLAESRLSMAGFVTQYYPVNTSNSGGSTTNVPVEKPTPGASAAEQIFYFELCNLLDGYGWLFVRGFGLDIYDQSSDGFDHSCCCGHCRHRLYYCCCCCSRGSWLLDLSKMPRYPSYFIEALVCQLACRLAQAQGSLSINNSLSRERDRALSRAKKADAADNCAGQIPYGEGGLPSRYGIYA